VRRASQAAAVLLLVLAACTPEPEPLPILFPVPEFAFRDQAGRAVGDADLRGAPWVADFVFTRCPSACPMLTAQMQNLKRRLGDDAARVTMVSFSVDPEHDTPEVLARYAEGYGIEGRWLFLTGPIDPMRRAVEQGFRVRMGERVAGQDGVYDIMHAQHFLLVDAQNRIRGYYTSDGEGMQRLERDVKRLLEDGEG
jgi:protein SCO1